MKSKIPVLAISLFGLSICSMLAQQPQTQTAPLSAINAKYANGVAPGYAPTAGSGLTLDLGGGTANCSGTIAQYTASTLTMTASTTNYVYLNTAANCVPAVKTTTFVATDIPIATVVTSGSVIAVGGITDVRTPLGVGIILPTGVSAGCPNVGGTILCIEASGQISSYGSPFGMGISCTAAGSFELGHASTSPNVCTLSYSNGTPASASVTDGTHPNTLSSPFTSSSQAYSYTSNTTFAGSSTSTNSQTASASTGITVSPCTFAGLGTGGTATGATASGTGNCAGGETSTLGGATGTLTSQGLGNTYAGQSFTFNPSGQYIYLLLTGGCGHTMYFNGFPTTFATTALTYTNLLGGVQTGMCLYSSPTYYTATGTQVQVHSL